MLDLENYSYRQLNDLIHNENYYHCVWDHYTSDRKLKQSPEFYSVLVKTVVKSKTNFNLKIITFEILIYIIWVHFSFRPNSDQMLLYFRMSFAGKNLN
jgi:hypothetical protein